MKFMSLLLFFLFSLCNCVINLVGYPMEFSEQGTLGELNTELAPIMKVIAFENGKLQVKQEMIDRLGGECGNIENYQVIDDMPSEEDASWQCGSKFFQSGGKPYSPTQSVLDEITSAFGVSYESLNIPFFPNGVHHDTGTKELSSWCGMPSPKATGFQEPQNYWENCVMQHAGYFNTLKCTGTQNQVHAVIGLAAMNADVCYPTHAHLNEEAYWQIGGSGTWNAWTHEHPSQLRNTENHLHYKNNQNEALDTYEYYGNAMRQMNAATEIERVLANGAKTITRHDHPAGTVHEMSTQPGEHMLMVYWWAVNENSVKDIKYHYAHYVTDSCSVGRIPQVQPHCGIPIPDDHTPSQCKANQKVVTGFDCEVSSTIHQEWYWTKYGRNGGVNGGYGSCEGRLFEFDCQTPSCRDSELEWGHWWVTCGYSWKNADDLNDGDYVIVDVKTEASNDPGSCYDHAYDRVLNIDSTGWKARDTQGDEGHWGFWFCYRKKTWGSVKNSGEEIVTGLMAKTTSYNPVGYSLIGQWDTHDANSANTYGDMLRTRDFVYFYSKKENPSLPN